MLVLFWDTETPISNTLIVFLVAPSNLARKTGEKCYVKPFTIKLIALRCTFLPSKNSVKSVDEFPATLSIDCS